MKVINFCSRNGYTIEFPFYEFELRLMEHKGKLFAVHTADRKETGLPNKLLITDDLDELYMFINNLETEDKVFIISEDKNDFKSIFSYLDLLFELDIDRSLETTSNIKIQRSIN